MKLFVVNDIKIDNALLAATVLIKKSSFTPNSEIPEKTNNSNNLHVLMAVS